jgi:hypothetical protein
VHFTPPAIVPVRGPATENVSSVTFNSTCKPFQVVQAPFDLLKTDSMYLLAESDGASERRNQDKQDTIRNRADKDNDSTNKKIDKQKGPLGLFDKLFKQQK